MWSVTSKFSRVGKKLESLKFTRAAAMGRDIVATNWPMMLESPSQMKGHDVIMN